MSFFLPTPRSLMKGSCAALLWLLCASIADAAPATGRGAAGPLCDPQTPTHRKLPRHPKSFGGPLATPAPSSRGVVTDMTARVRRGTRANLACDNEAIQDDTPAAHVGADDRPVPVLRPLGVLIGALDLRPRTRAFSPRSPRGPPFSA
jgi:hypothetical protein